jgi:hypothetical protein
MPAERVHVAAEMITEKSLPWQMTPTDPLSGMATYAPLDPELVGSMQL